MVDIFLRSVPSDADRDDARLYDPTQSDGGGSTLVLSPSEGAVIVTGFVPAIVFALAAATGAINVGGNAPSLQSIFAPATGAVIVSGNAATLSSIFAPGEGAVVVGGNVGAIVVGTIISPADGSVVVDGYAPAIQVSAAPTTTPPSLGGEVRRRFVAPQGMYEAGRRVRQDQELVLILEALAASGVFDDS